MIDEKKREEAASKYASSSWIDDEYPGEIQEAFNEGINWFLDNLWHPASEEPKDNYDILIESLNGICTEYAAYRHNSAQLWSDFVDRSHTTRWLYIADLLKGGGNERA